MEKKFCAVRFCCNSYACKGVHMFRFPRDLDRCLQWVEACSQGMLFGKRIALGQTLYDSTYRVCHLHFDETMYAGKSQKRLKQDAVPTLFLGKKELLKIKCERKQAEAIHARGAKRLKHGNMNLLTRNKFGR